MVVPFSVRSACSLHSCEEKRLSLRGCGATKQLSTDASPRKIVGEAVCAKEFLNKGPQQVHTGKDRTTCADVERLDGQDSEVGDGKVFLREDTRSASGYSEGRQEKTVSVMKSKHVIIDKFWDAEEDLPYDVLEEVLSQYDRPVAPSSPNDARPESFHDAQMVLYKPKLAGEPENRTYVAVETLNYIERASFQEYDLTGEVFEEFTPGSPREDDPVPIVGGSSVRYEDSFVSSSFCRDDLFSDIEGRKPSIETTPDTRGKTDLHLEETPCGISDSEELSFRDAFYKGGTDWSSLHDVDEYGLPYTSSPPSSFGHICASEDAEGSEDAKGSMQYSVAELQPSSQSRHSHDSLSEPSLCSKENIEVKKLNRPSKLKQGDLSSFLGFKRKLPPDADVSMKRTEQRDIGTYFGLAPLAEQASAATSFLSKFRPRHTSPVAATVDNWQGNGGSGWKRNENSRSCPFYKKMPGTPFTVDAFKFGAVEGCKAYFLSHFHSDHYGGLTRSWSHGPIFCTEITARLVSMHLGVDSRWLRPVKLDSFVMVEGVEVKFLEANHCPGAALILFQTCGQRILHTGDFRACKSMQGYPDLLRARITCLYLDTTYCNPKYNFPLQENVIRHVVRLTAAALARNPRTLVTVGAYSIGKERVYLGIAKALKLKIYADKRRARTLRALDWPDLTERLCSDASSSRLHVLPISHLNATKLRAYMQSLHPTYSAVLAFRPTGWTYSEKFGSNLEELRPQCSGIVTIYGVPYSEHSSYSELQEFVQFLKPQKIIATVNIGSAAQRERMQAHFNQWLKC